MAPVSMREIVLASGNRGKQAELAPLFAAHGIALLNQGELGIASAPEEGLTFVENALAKARHVTAIAERPALADDSGLIVDALHGAPGVRSARFAGAGSDDAANNRRLLAELDRRRNRRARFHCVLVLMRHAADPAPLIATGTWEGEILDAPRGSGGFGYDPLFLDPDLGRSAAELSRDEKAAVSHRGRAVQALLEGLEDWLRT